VERCSPDIYALSYDMRMLSLVTAKDRKDFYFRHVEEILRLIFENDSSPVYDLLFDETSILTSTFQARFFEGWAFLHLGILHRFR